MSTPTIIVYGITNCDTVKKARAWLQEQGLAYQFHDFKKQGVPAERLPAWMAAVGWEKLLNRQGTTWRKLDAAVQAGVTGAPSAAALMCEQPSVIKRPVVEWQGGPAGDVTVGFSPEAWNARAASQSKA
ncbi:ArsC family reductase [Diaphorobacter sp.]|uniref:ArsC family reductase n=1 Tax=Diaphorobacter sp. TaxID=1934310 RepID=UPI0025853AD8|nr:ArsC family reductase [Diaphorobacter sp.]